MPQFYWTRWIFAFISHTHTHTHTHTKRARRRRTELPTDVAALESRMMLSATTSDATTVLIGSGSTSSDSGGSATSSCSGDGSSQNPATSNCGSGAISLLPSSSNAGITQTSANLGSGSISSAESGSGSGSGTGGGSGTGAASGTGIGNGSGIGSGAGAGTGSGSGSGTGPGTGANEGVLTATDDNYFDLANDITSFIAGSVLGNDIDTRAVAQSLVASLVTQTSHGTVILDRLGMFTYCLQDNTFAGDDAFTYQVSDGVSTANATVTINVARATILGGNGNDVSNNQRNPTIIWDGQKASLAGNVTNAGNNPVTYSWSFTGDPIKDYTLETNTTTYLSQADVSQPNVNFYYYNSDMFLEMVQLTIRAGQQRATVETYFDVHRPKAAINWEGGQVNFYPVPNRPTLSFENRRFTAFSAPTNPSGDLKWIQVIDSTYIYETFRDGRRPISFSATNRLDSSSPFPLTAGNTLVDNPASKVNPGAFDDYREDHFSDYLLFRPENGIYVPITQNKWYWVGQVGYVTPSDD